MDAAASKELCEPFPIFTRLLDDGSSDTSFAHWGVECGPGWGAILTRLFTRAESIARAMQANGTPEESLPAVAQVKNKFGTLRVYVMNSTPEIAGAVMEAGRASETVCEKCGAPGVKRSAGWVAVLCDEHAG